jgi:tetratricopeptide (TPR) repeat protein/predicted Ser/Thr protein kinase
LQIEIGGGFRFASPARRSTVLLGMPVRTVEGTSTVEVDMGERPASDRLAMERARARTERALFGRADPAAIGRYEVLDPIASGGMGFVYAAHDPELDRRVALKVLHPDRRRDGFAQDRLIKEARALARLDHPNIVPVHDALNHDGELVIVMELVTGETLDSWQTAAPRTWHEVVDAYAQAGAGLAAAHGLDIIHRDFKPSNAIMGADGRVRVLDFGLARFVGESPDAARTGERAGMMSTASGVILGTLAYAAPEQLSGAAVTAASDQFSFCVALHHALEGIVPFHGTTVAERVASIRRDPPALVGDGRRVPGWLRAVVRRGLAAEPAHRHASMQVLLHELARPRGWKRWRWLVITAGLVAATAAVTLGLRELAGGMPACDEDEQGLAAVWGPWRRVAVSARLQQLGTRYAPEVQDRVLGTLDRWTQTWTAVHRTACTAHQRGAESDALFDRRMLCLHQRLDDLGAALNVLDGLQRDALSRAIDVVVGNPSPDICANTARLLDEPEPPATPERVAQVTAVRAHLAAGAALDHAGLAEQATRVLAEASVEAERTDYAPVIAEAKLAYGRALIAQGDNARATPVLRDTMMRALAAGQNSLAVEAAARRIYTEGVQSGDLGRFARDLEFVEPMSEALMPGQLARPLLLNNAGVVYMAARRRDDALRYFLRAHEVIARSGPPDLELTIVDQNLAMLSPDAATRTRLSRERWDRLKATLGEHHLDTLAARFAYARFGADTGEAYRQTNQACDAYHDFHPVLVGQYVECESAAGFLASELGLGEAARAAYTAAINATAGATDPDLIMARRLAAGELAVLRGDLGQVHAELVPVLEARRDSERWWERHGALRAELALGLAAAAAGERAEATRHLEVAIRGLADIVNLNQALMYRLQLARARRALAAVTPDSPEHGAGERH